MLLATLVGGYLAAGGAGAINHYIERDIDARMSRTSRRPLPSGRIEPRAALWFGIALGALVVRAVRARGEHDRRAARDGGPARLRVRLHDVAEAAHDAEHRDRRRGRRRAAARRLGRRDAAASTPSAFYLFAIVFYWTPPHFWALALLIKDEYARTGIPMLPVVDGEAETRRQILLYGWLLLAITALPRRGRPVRRDLRGRGRACSACVFLWLCIRLYRRADRRSAAILFHYSLAYLALLFCAMAIDQRRCRPRR